MCNCNSYLYNIQYICILNQGINTYYCILHLQGAVQDNKWILNVKKQAIDLQMWNPGWSMQLCLYQLPFLYLKAALDFA